MITLLKQAASFDLFNSLDIQLAIRLAENKSPLLLLIFALLSAKTRSGHVCLFIDKIKPAYFFEGRQVEIAFSLWKKAGAPDANRIYADLKQSDAVCEPDQSLTKPLVLSDNKLYFQRMWADEGLVADFFSRHLLEGVDEHQLASILKRLFSSSCTKEDASYTQEDWQKIAIAVAVTSRISIISGGPGTGKTTIVAVLLATLIKLSHEHLIIQLVAPTGKAAARLIESLINALSRLDLSKEEKEIMPKQAQTIHRLLGAKFDTQLLCYHKDNPLLLDVLIVDEASMIDLPIMARLIEALPDHARVILLGDKDQLSSVQVGSVFSDLCFFSKFGYSSKRASQLSKITDCDLSNFISDDSNKIKDRICLLRKSYRFDPESEIGQLAVAINQSNISLFEKLLAYPGNNVVFYSLNSPEEYQQLISDAVKNYTFYLDKIREGSEPEEILNAFSQYRLLAALRDGPYGVIGLNNRLEQFLHHQMIIQGLCHGWNKNYEGRPIMIVKNDSSLNLFNGDVGIILSDGKGVLKAYFQLPNGMIKRIQVGCLPKHETAFVMTVHKSQGSEFNHVTLVLPPIFVPIITKEMIYTAITRAKSQITIYTNIHVFLKALQTPTERHSGLIGRLV